MLSTQKKRPPEPPDEGDAAPPQSGKRGTAPPSDTQNLEAERLEQALAEERQHAATLRASVEDLRFKMTILEKSYAKQLADARTRAEAAEKGLAEEKARAIRRAEPDQPIGSFLLTEAFFWQAVNNQDLPELTDRFRDESQRVQELCEKQLKKDQHHPTALFMLGGISGRKAILDGLTGHRFESVNTAVKARQYLKLLNRYHPEQEDAYLGLGLYDYFASQLPWFARVLSKLVLGLGGDQAKGIAELERAGMVLDELIRRRCSA